jgi:hypothetical protein
VSQSPSKQLPTSRSGLISHLAGRIAVSPQEAGQVIATADALLEEMRSNGSLDNEPLNGNPELLLAQVQSSSVSIGLRSIISRDLVHELMNGGPASASTSLSLGP